MWHMPAPPTTLPAAGLGKKGAKIGRFQTHVIDLARVQHFHQAKSVHKTFTLVLSDCGVQGGPNLRNNQKA